MQFLPEPNAGVVLELAHGTGDLLVDLDKAGYHAVGTGPFARYGTISSAKTDQAKIGWNANSGGSCSPTSFS